MKRILVLAAHPDDETLGCGGTIHRLSKEGHHVQLITFTDGEGSRGETDKNRNDLLDKVSSVLGIKKHSSSNFPDNAMDSVPLISLCKFIESEVDYTPDIIFTHYPEDLNIDHQLVAKATFTVFRPQEGFEHKIYCYFVASSSDYNPTSTFNGNSYFKLSEENIKGKLKALKLYDSEMRDYPHSRSYTNIKNLSKVWGSEVGINFAEKFINLRELI
jgi:N-acetylglucosamine malate deacetylase 1